MNTSQIGNIGEAKALLEFAKRGLSVYLPFGNNEKSDLIVEFNGKLNKIQIKTSNRIENGVMIFNLYSVVNGVKCYYKEDDVDYFIFYHIDRDLLFMGTLKDSSKTEFRIRFEPTKNGQTHNVKLEKDFLFDEYFGRLTNEELGSPAK